MCLECSPKNRLKNPDVDAANAPIFLHSPHAMMLSEVEAVFTKSVESALHSVGGIEVLFPLFSQLDVEFARGYISLDENEEKPNIAAMLLKLIERLLKSSINAQQQMLQSKGFLLAAHWIEESCPSHIDRRFCRVLFDILEMLENQPYGILLTRHICDYILFNPALWIYSEADVQIDIYRFFAKEFVKHGVLSTIHRRISTVLVFIHAMKYYYWLDNPKNSSGFEAKGLNSLSKKRPKREDVKTIRGYILLFIKGLLCIPLDGDDSNLRNSRRSPTGDEVQAMLNYLQGDFSERSFSGQNINFWGQKRSFEVIFGSKQVIFGSKSSF